MSEKLPTYNKLLDGQGTRQTSPIVGLIKMGDKILEKIASKNSWSAEKVAAIGAADRAYAGPKKGGTKRPSCLALNRKLAKDGKKKCGTCKKVKSITEFTRHGKTWDGLDCQCRVCKKNYKDKFYSDPKNVVRRDIKQALYIKNNPEKVAESQKKSYAKYRSERIAYTRKYALEHAEASAASKKRWYGRNSEIQAVRMAARNKKLREENVVLKTKHNNVFRKYDTEFKDL